MKRSPVLFSTVVVSLQVLLHGCPGDRSSEGDLSPDVIDDGVEVDATSDVEGGDDVVSPDAVDAVGDVLPNLDTSIEDVAEDPGDAARTEDEGVDLDGAEDSGDVTWDAADTVSGASYEGEFGEAERWAVPDAGIAGGFYAASITLSQRAWTLRDMDGDGLFDLVQTADPTADSRHVLWDDDGPHWRVFLNDGGGLESSFVRWAVPDNGLSDGFATTDSNSDNRVWSLLDLDGDQLPDLAHTMDRLSDATFNDGAPYWRVHLNQGTGFADEPVRWSVPDPGTDRGFYSTNEPLGPACFDTVDLNGDGLPDLVQTCQWRDDGVVDEWAVLSDEGGDYWLVYVNTGTGFEGTGQRWSVPLRGEALGSPPQRGFFHTSRYASWTTVDLNGDGLRDLVHTSMLESGSVFDDDGPIWRVYLGSGTSFATDFTRWPVPHNGLEDGFHAPSFEFENQVWTLHDLTGDNRPDLIQTADPAGLATGPFSDGDGYYWRLYANMGDSFGSSEVFALPDSGQQHTYGTWNSYDAPNDRYWATINMDSDGFPDFIQTCAPQLDVTHDVFTDESGAYWNVYRGRRALVP